MFSKNSKYIGTRPNRYQQCLKMSETSFGLKEKRIGKMLTYTFLSSMRNSTSSQLQVRNSVKTTSSTGVRSERSNGVRSNHYSVRFKNASPSSRKRQQTG